MTQAQKTAKAKFKQAIAYRQKTGVSLKEAFAHIYGKKKVGGSQDYNTRKKEGRVKPRKKAIPKKKVAKKIVKKAAKKVVKKKYGLNKSLDLKYSAKKPGKRKSASGNTYYESRENRSDKGKVYGIEKIDVEINKGDILECSWGYDQTNIDFYYVIKKAGSYITFIPMSNKIVEYNNNDMTGKVIPNEPNYNAKPLRRKIQKSSISNSLWVKINTYSSASKWNGKPQYFSSYA